MSDENQPRSDWSWCYEGYDPAQEGLREALCTVGNGYLATRGAAPESTADQVHYPGTYAAGIYNRRRSEVAGVGVENECLVNLPNWLPVTFRIDGGPWFDIDAADLLEYRQCLDLRHAVLTRWFRFRDAQGRTTAVTQRRFVSMGFPHAGALRVAVTAEDWSGRLELRSTLDGRVANTLVERYRDLAHDHLHRVRTSVAGEGAVLLEAQTNDSRIPVAMAARNRLYRGPEPSAAERRTPGAASGAEGPRPAGAAPGEVGRRLVGGDGWIGHDLDVALAPGETVTLEKVVTVFTGRDRASYEPAVEATRWLPRLERFDQLLAGHAQVWERLWQRFRLELVNEPQVQRIIRLHLLHLLQTVSPHTVDLDVGVPARGLHGEAYRGHILWDELFVFPVLNLRAPMLTRALLRYRHRRLPEARQAARDAGYAGAMYPWQSGSDGREESQRWHLNPRSGHWVPDVSWRQRHIGIAIAYQVWHYYQVTGDQEFLSRYGIQMLVEIARFWASLAEYDQRRQRYVIRGVMGPDEFHTGYPGTALNGIDNNAYTNVMVVWVLLQTMDALHRLPDLDGQELTEVFGITDEELAHWRDLSRRMFVPFHADGIISQFEGYEQLAELDWEGYRRRYGNIRRLDRILEAEGDSPNRYQASKQADVLMLFYLLSAEELTELLERLDYQFTGGDIPRTVDYYLARTSHGSTLSAVVHVWVLARAHRERAVEFFCEALRTDVADVQGGTTPEGIHLAAMAGTVDLLQRCFTGLETRQDRLLLNPYWPEALGVLTVSVRYRGHPLLLRINGPGVEVTAGPGLRHPIEVACRGEVAELAPGAVVRFPLNSR